MKYDFIEDIKPRYIREVLINIQDKVNDYYDYEYVLRENKCLVDSIYDILSDIDFFTMNYETDLGFYWSGCLTEEPWCELGMCEESILNSIVHNHISVEKDLTFSFRENKESPLNKFFKKHKDGYGGNIAYSINNALRIVMTHIEKIAQKDTQQEFGMFGKLVYIGQQEEEEEYA